MYIILPFKAFVLSKLIVVQSFPPAHSQVGRNFNITVYRPHFPRPLSYLTFPSC